MFGQKDNATESAEDLAFATKNNRRGARKARTFHVRVKRACIKIHLGVKRREDGSGPMAMGVLVKKGVRMRAPSSPAWQQAKARANQVLAHA
jgi:hypothetical protein